MKEAPVQGAVDKAISGNPLRFPIQNRAHERGARSRGRQQNHMEILSKKECWQENQ